MEGRWPRFAFEQRRGSTVCWTGPVRGFQKEHQIEVYWGPQRSERPYVLVRKPALRPREGGSFEQIPHLMFWSERPQLSGLCLFDPEGGEWTNKLLIADTTMVWAAVWILYYELWHVDGVWRGGGVGPESTAEARAAAIYRETGQLA
jgi:hypothetical protein